jgi:uncharacterized repeat protein (TIGR03803 family)
MRKIAAARLTFCMMLLFATAASAQTYKVLNNMKVNSTTGPYSPEYLGVFAQARDGNLYTTVQLGGTSAHGVVVRLTPAGQLTVIHNFVPSTGNVPRGGLTLGTDGNLYGTTCQGGNFNDGVVFKISTGGNYTVLHHLNINNAEGTCPEAAPVQGTDGNFYGTTTEAPNPHVGTVYKMTPSGGLTTLYLFNVVNSPCCTAPNGEGPLALTLGTDGNFYGTAKNGGTSTYGTIFKISTTGRFALLHSFSGPTKDGGVPIGPIIQASDGNLYGMTNDGILVYKITPTGAFHGIFTLTQSTGDLMFAGFTQATDGKLYTASSSLGAGGVGTIFSLTTGGTPSVIHPFSLANLDSGGSSPQVSLFQHTNGKLYGNTTNGGSGLGGVFYSLDMGLAPFVSLLPPLSSGKVGKVIQLLGQGFTGTTAVKFNGTVAPFSVVSNTYVTATVPNGATTGSITVTTPGGTLKSNKQFRVTPQITSFSPGSGAPGTAVTITGVSLKQTTKVAFGALAATFTVNSDTKVTVIVPSGAVTSKITVTTSGGTAQTATTFSVT